MHQQTRPLTTRVFPVSERRRRASKLKLQWKSGYGMLLPAFWLLAMFMYYPALSAIVFSFSSWDGFNAPIFNGLRNYIALVGDSVFWISVRNVTIWALVKIVVEISVPLFVAVVIYHLRSKRMQYIYRVIFVVPVVVPGIVLFLIWGFFFDPNVGVLNHLFDSVGLGAIVPNWLGDPHIALFALMFVGFPFVVPFNLLIFFSGLQNIPEEVMESVRLEGVGRWRRFWQIEVPLVIGQMKLLLILTMIQLLQNVTLPLVLTNGGPGYSTYVPGLYMYLLAFQNGQFGLGMAVSMIIFILVLGLTWIQFRYIRSETEYST